LFAHDLHVSLAVATVVAMVGAAIEAGGRAVTGRPPGRLAAAMSAILIVVVGMTAAGGLAMLVRGERPKEFLHFVYAAVAFVPIPIGDSLAAHASPRRRAAARFLTVLVALGVIARLFATG
jgi:hypothetical protein